MARVKRSLGCELLAHAVVVHQPREDRFGLFIVGNFPHLGDILERGDKALARRGIVDGRDARRLPLASFDLDHLEGSQITRIQYHDAVWQVIADGDVFAVARDRGVARIDAGANLGDELQVVDVIFRYPAVGRGEVDVAPVGGIFRPAVQGETRGEARDRLKAVAVQQRGMVIAQLHHDEEIERDPDLEHGLVRKFYPGLAVQQVCRANFRHAPRWDFRQGLVDQFSELRDLLSGKFVLECRHLGRDAPVVDGGDRLLAFESSEVLRQQRRTHLSETIGAMTGRAVFVIQRAGVVDRKSEGHRDHREKREYQDENLVHKALSVLSVYSVANYYLLAVMGMRV